MRIPPSFALLAALAATLAAASPARAFCVIGCEPTEEDAKKVFANLVHQKFDPDAQIVDFKVDRFWRIDVEGSGHAGIEYYYTAKVAFPKGANLQCKADAEGKVKEGCSPNTTFYSTTIQNQMIKEKQYVEPGRVIDFKDETRFDQEGLGWKGQDGNKY